MNLHDDKTTNGYGFYMLNKKSIKKNFIYRQNKHIIRHQIQQMFTLLLLLSI